MSEHTPLPDSIPTEVACSAWRQALNDIWKVPGASDLDDDAFAREVERLALAALPRLVRLHEQARADDRERMEAFEWNQRFPR